MKQIISGLVFLSLSALAESELKLEGSCHGNLFDGTQVSFTYYSNYDGCTQNIKAAIQFAPNFGSGHYKGKRAFEEGQDIYNIETYRVTFKDSTNNLGGVFSYLDVVGKRQSINIQCEIRDYEYDECSM